MLTYGGEHSDRHARSQDRKIGSAFIDLESLGGHARDRQQRIRQLLHSLDHLIIRSIMAAYLHTFLIIFHLCM